MGGTSSSQQSTNQESQVTPYQPAAAGLTGILGNLMPSVDAINGTPQTNQAFSRLFNRPFGRPFNRRSADRSNQAGPVPIGGPSGRPHSAHEPS